MREVQFEAWSIPPRWAGEPLAFPPLGPAMSQRAAVNGKPLLSIRGLSVRFGGIVALDNVSFEVAPGQICGLIGPNGAGKTTLFNCLSRLYHADSGSSQIEGPPLLDLPKHAVAPPPLRPTLPNPALARPPAPRANFMIGVHCR